MGYKCFIEPLSLFTTKGVYTSWVALVWILGDEGFLLLTYYPLIWVVVVLFYG